MAERNPIGIKSAELVQNINHELIAPELTTGSFLTTWYDSLKTKRLNWFAETKAKSTPIQSVKFNYSTYPSNEKSELTISFPSIPSEFVTRQIPLSIGIAHCAEPPLHGEIRIETIDQTNLEKPEVKDLITAFGVSVPENKPGKYNLSTQITSPSDLKPSSLELLHLGVQNDVLILLGISPSQRNLVYLDPEVARLVDATVYALIKSNTVRFDPFSFPSNTAYHQKLREQKQAPYGFDIENPYTGPRYMRRWLFKMFTEVRKRKLSKKDFHQHLLDFYEQNSGEDFFDSLPPIKASAHLGSYQNIYDCGRVMTFLEFQQIIANIIPNTSMKMVDPSAQELEDINDIHNIIITTDGGVKIGFFLSRSSGHCILHKSKK